MLPPLRDLARPGMPADSIAGAAQVSLAKLGERAAIEQLEHELNDPKEFDMAIDKLGRVGTHEALSILMNYLVEHIADSSMYRDYGDYGDDLRSHITTAVSGRLMVGPVAPNGNFSVSLRDWVTWWSQSSGESTVLSISHALPDPYLRCLARKVEWGFPNAIFDLTESRDPQVLPVLRQLAEFGDHSGRSFNLATVRGRAGFGLAELGTSESSARSQANWSALGTAARLKSSGSLEERTPSRRSSARSIAPIFFPSTRASRRRTGERSRDAISRWIVRSRAWSLLLPRLGPVSATGRNGETDGWSTRIPHDSSSRESPRTNSGTFPTDVATVVHERGHNHRSAPWACRATGLTAVTGPRAAADDVPEVSVVGAW